MLPLDLQKLAESFTINLSQALCYLKPSTNPVSPQFDPNILVMSFPVCWWSNPVPVLAEQCLAESFGVAHLLITKHSPVEYCV